jgi:enamine deaminase RidA (YjgF/YER057c/UK114 family)
MVRCPVELRLEERGWTLPRPPPPAANYTPWVLSGTLLHVAGQIPMVDGVVHGVGEVGRDLDVEAARDVARVVALNLISQVRTACGGDLGRVVRVIKLNGFVRASGDFGDQPKVIDAASEVMRVAFGEAGVHARSAVGVASLPFGVAVEIDGVFEISRTSRPTGGGPG